MLDFLRVAEDGFLSKDADGIVIVSELGHGIIGPESVRKVLSGLQKIDKAYDSEISVLPVDLPAGRVIFSPTGKLTDYDDVRSFYEAANKGMRRALTAGVKNPLLVLPKYEKFPNVKLVTLLGALEAVYVPIQVREEVPEKKNKINALYVYSEDNDTIKIVSLAKILENGRIVARDIGGGDPERMAGPRIEHYIRELFEDNYSCIKVEVIDDQKIFEKEYPLFAAVNRAANEIERHKGRIIYLKYEPEGQITQTLGLVGKGITFDTGGANVKIKSGMIGMSRDKCGAAAVAGFMKIVSIVKPRNIRIVGALCVARNSIGENSYVSDEVITARSKARVRIQNTDAEGRMVMADILYKLKEDFRNYPNVHLMTIATLTGHACLAAGPYSIVMDNSVAHKNGIGLKLQTAGESLAEPFEISILRREDLLCHVGKAEGDDVRQSVGSTSVCNQRGHQGPAGFLILSSGLDKHELSSSAPLNYSHLDIAGSAGEFPQEATGAPVLALASAYIKELNLF